MSNYQDCNWIGPRATNGASGEGLADFLIAKIKQLGSIKTICDLGCGNGHLAGQLAANGYEVTGIDASETGHEIACRNYPDVDFVQSLIDPGLFTNGVGPFDLIVSSDVIEHMYRPADLLETAALLLKPKGHLLVGTPYHGYIKNLVLSATGKMDSHFTVLNDGGHIKFFSVKTLSTLTENCGFTGLKFSFYGRAPWLWKNMLCHARKVG